MSDARRYAVWPEPRSRSLKGSRPSVPHGTNFFSNFQALNADTAHCLCCLPPLKARVPRHHCPLLCRQTSLHADLTLLLPRCSGAAAVYSCVYAALIWRAAAASFCCASWCPLPCICVVCLHSGLADIGLRH